ncbi:hypothetical protein KP509_32G015100 [Ceratopteris richardii]|uniref:Fanconi anemia group D2 protein n=1 Tax=Ceratopteris richardii TaxID=49495 RepID=A0A8T2QQZ9_CERRI|nr:hypothetical protein KP509_32G015100 [Ceratopteris richardii]
MASLTTTTKCASSSRQEDDRKSMEGPTSYFLSLLAECGCTLCRQGMVLPIRDIPSFLHKLEFRLKSDSSLTQKFLEGLQDFLLEDSNLHRLLIPFTGCRQSIGSTDSLARLLLSIALIQTQVANILLEKLPEHCIDTGSHSLPSLRDSIPRLILSQLRWLDYLIDGENVTTKLMEVLSICPTSIQKEIICLIPEIVSDDVHELVVCTLEQMLQGESQLLAPILDAFSNLNLKEELLDQVVSIAIASLRTADAEDLPLVVKFLLQSTTAENVRRIVYQLRENLHFTSLASATKATKHDTKMKGKSLMKDWEVLVLETIRSGLCFQNVICEAILKEIRNLDRIQDHKVIDFWLLLIIYANGGPYKKLADSIVKRKAIGGFFGTKLLTQSIKGRIALIQDYFQPLLSLSQGLLACREHVAQQLGSHIYVLLFEDFKDGYHRQEVLGSLITHMGSGVDHEVGSALDALISISSKHPEELLSLSSFINGILDYLEGFQDNHLHQVYKVFGQLALTTWANGPVAKGSSVANELLIVLRKQITNPDTRYKRMGIIGVIKLMSCLSGDYDLSRLPSTGETQASFDETFGLLQLIMEICKTSSAARSFFYDELAVLCESVSLHPSIIEWVSKQTIEFESLFLLDLEAGNVPTELKSSESLEGDAWMNLDGEVSPILLNIQNLLMSDGTSSAQALIFLPSSFRLLAAVERATNHGSLGNIDALLGCPLYLPSHQLFIGDEWHGLSEQIKESLCLSIYYGINWIRELINAYSTQVHCSNESLTQASREEISTKLLKRMRNLIVVCTLLISDCMSVGFPCRLLEILLGECIKTVPSLSLPVLHSEADRQDRRNHISNSKKEPVSKLQKKRKAANLEEFNASTSQLEKNDTQVSNGRQKQKKIQDCFSQKSKDSPTQQQVTGVTQASGHLKHERASQLEEQRWKFRPLCVDSLSILSIPQYKPSLDCCLDPCAELPIHLYLLRDLLHKLESLEIQTRRVTLGVSSSHSTKLPSGLGPMNAAHLFKRLKPVFPSLRTHLDTAARILCAGSGFKLSDSCKEHWNTEALSAGNPDFNFPVESQCATAGSILAVTIRCLSKVFTSSELVCESSVPTITGILLAFDTVNSQNKFIHDLLPPPSPGSLEYAFCIAYSYLDELFEAAATISFSVATDLVMAQKSLVSCAEGLMEACKEAIQRSGSFRSTSFLSYLKNRLSVSAGRVLQHQWKYDGQGKCWSKGDLVQPLLKMFLEYNDAPLELLEELACNIMPQVPVQKTGTKDVIQGYPTLCPGNLLVWYRVQLEEHLKIFTKMIKDALSMQKSKTAKEDSIDFTLVRARQCATILVSLVNLSKIHPDKVALHSVAVKFGGKFIDCFLKGIDFWQAQYVARKDAINAVVKELQKATRTIQTLCSEAKGSKKMPVTSKVPAVKRSLERYVFCIKALLHSTSQGNSFWMGNLKHKNLQGDEVGSQLPVSDEERDEVASVGDDDDEAEQAELGGSGDEIVC